MEWTPWCPLDGQPVPNTIPPLPGLYRIRRAGRDTLDYVGQTGAGSMNLRKRLAMLRGAFAREMPYRAPHTAGPALWALRQISRQVTFEVSVAPLDAETPKPTRLGLEALALFEHREAWGASPTVNFGRMPDGFRISSDNNARLVAAGRRFRGGPTTANDESHVRGVPPRATEVTSPVSATWGGHAWTGWVTLEQAGGELPPPDARGVYRIRARGHSALLYVGQGKVRDRLRTHEAKTRRRDHAQGLVLKQAGPLECSWATYPPEAPELHLLEYENDLIALHLLATGVVPGAQFLG